MTEKRYFGTDGIRGRVGETPITAEFMLKLGRAAGSVLAREGRATVLIGKDTRISGYMLESALEAGFVAAGVGVRLLGPMPTPAVAYLTRVLGASAGIVISASHNPYFDNGIKFFSGAGEKLPDELELAIEHALDAPPAAVPSEHIGKAARVHDATARYVEFCRSSALGLNLHGLKIIVDCAHGATYHIAPKLFAELGAEIVALGVEPDGLNINRDCGTTAPETLQRAVREGGANLGIAFDGDGDRVQMVDHSGHLVDGDDLLYVLACDWHARGLLHGPVVGTLMSNFGLEQAITTLGMPFLRAQVGDRHVLQMLKNNQGILGGEASGHLLCLNLATTGDGLIGALQVLDVLVRRNATLAQLRAGLRRIPQMTVNVPVTGGAALMAHADVQHALKVMQRNLAGRGRVVLRPSGTEPLIRVTVEAEDVSEVERLAADLAGVVRMAAKKVHGGEASPK